MKSVRDFYSERLGAEKPAFLRVIKAVPPDKAAYRPHERSTSAGDLVWLLASELEDACTLVDRGEVNYVVKAAPTVPDSIAAYEKHAASLESRLTKLDDAKWGSKATLNDVDLEKKYSVEESHRYCTTYRGHLSAAAKTVVK